MPRPIDAPTEALLMTSAARNLLELEMQELCSSHSGDGRLDPWPLDPRLSVAGRIDYLDRVLRAAVILHDGGPDPGLVAVGLVADLVAAGGAKRTVRLVAGPGGRERCGTLDLSTDSLLGTAVLWQTTGTTVRVADGDGVATSFTISRIREPLGPVPRRHRWHDAFLTPAWRRPAGWRGPTMAGGRTGRHRRGYVADRALIDKGRLGDGRRIRRPHHAARPAEGPAGL